MRVTEDKYNLVKSLLDAGLKKSKIKVVVPFSYNTISKISKSGDMDDYKRITTEEYEAKKANEAKKEADVVEVTPAQLDTTNSIVALLKAIEYQLQEANDKLERLLIR